MSIYCTFFKKTLRILHTTMFLINTLNGHLQLSSALIIKPNAAYDELLLQLKEASLEFIKEDIYSLYHYINIFKYHFDHKFFHFELFFDKKNLKSISFNFSCDAGFEISYEQWMLNVFGNQNHFNWGSIELSEHPKFGVPLIKMQYNKATL